MSFEKYNDGIPSKILELFADGASITKVCVKLCICRDTYYDWKERFPEFKKAASRGEQISQMWWEDKGRDGMFGEIEKFAGSSWQFVMKNRFRDSYSDQQSKTLEHTLIEKLLESK
jgi:hypothetical protein